MHFLRVYKGPEIIGEIDRLAVRWYIWYEF